MSGRTTRRLGVCCRRAWCCTRSSAFRTSWRSSRLTLGEVARAEGNHDGARELLQQSLTLMRNVGERLGVPGTLDAVAHLAMTTGHPQPATGLAAAADQLRATTGTQAWPMSERRRAEWVVTAREVLGEVANAAARAQGAGMTWEQAMAFALHQLLNVIEDEAVSYTHLRAHETVLDLVCRLLLEKKK